MGCVADDGPLWSWPACYAADVRTLSKRQIAEKHVIFMVSYIYIVTLSGPSCALPCRAASRAIHAMPGLPIDCDAKRDLAAPSPTNERPLSQRLFSTANLAVK